MKKQYMNYIGYSDVHPYEVLRFSPSGKTAYLRSMNSSLKKDWKPEVIPGGFSGHCVNQDQQEWDITSDPTGREVTVRLHRNGRWHCSAGSRYSNPCDKPVRFYDYNF